MTLATTKCEHHENRFPYGRYLWGARLDQMYDVFGYRVKSLMSPVPSHDL